MPLRVDAFDNLGITRIDLQVNGGGGTVSPEMMRRSSSCCASVVSECSRSNSMVCAAGAISPVISSRASSISALPLIAARKSGVMP